MKTSSRTVVLVIVLTLACGVERLLAQAISSPAVLQFYEASHATMEERQVDLFLAGYGAMWLPPPGRGDTNQSVGYDVFDRFDLGRPRQETLYGTETGLKAAVAVAHRAAVNVYTDLVLNHNGFRDRTNGSFVAQGGYPGFALTLPGIDVDGDFHDPNINFDNDPLNGQLLGLNDIAQEKNHLFIRHPVSAGDPQNIPGGSLYNRPDANHARFYADQDLGGLTVFDPELGQSVTLYDFNSTDPLQGDPVVETALDLLKRNARWMIQEIGVDGFRLDAVPHFPESTLDHLDQVVFRANPRLQHDGSIKPVFSFSEVLNGNKSVVQQAIRQDLPDAQAIAASNTNVGGNRDALDFPLFFALRDNLIDEGTHNNWHGIRTASQDTYDDGLRNGSQGIAFVDSHDRLGEVAGGPGDGFPGLKNVAYAYALLKPGQAIVYFNAKEFGPNRPFPNDGKDDALGGLYGTAVTTLVDLRNTHGRGDFHERWIDEPFGDDNGNGQQESSIYIYERSNSMLVGLSNRNDTIVETRNGVQTNFAAGTILVELTGNAADASIDPAGVIPETIRVTASGQVHVSIPGNGTHGQGYVVYGLPRPEGSLSLSNVSSTLAGATPTVANNGTARLGDIDVIHAETFDVQLTTMPVSVADPATGLPVRDFAADADRALLRIDGGVELNSLAGIDHAVPGGVSYGFEEFTDGNVPGYIDGGGGQNIGTGTGSYLQTIDATQLSEGRHFITTRAFRQRDDGGPAVFQDFKRVVYIDRLPPEAEVVSFEPFASFPQVLDNRDLIVRSVDQTADRMHTFLDLPAGVSDAQVLQLALAGQFQAGDYDRDSKIYGFFNVTTGNHVATVVTLEPTFDGVHGFNVQRFSGLFTDTGIGAGFGDLDFDGLFEPEDLAFSAFGFERVLYSDNSEFNPAADLTGDGLVQWDDLVALDEALISQAASAATLAAYDAMLLRRGDVNFDGSSNCQDIDALVARLGFDDFRADIDSSGLVDQSDLELLVQVVFGTQLGDANLDGYVDGQDFLAWNNHKFSTAASWCDGNFNGDGSVDGRDFLIWNTWKFTSADMSSVPEPMVGWASLLWTLALLRRVRWAIRN